MQNMYNKNSTLLSEILLTYKFLHSFFFPSFLWLHLQHMEVPRLRVKSEVQVLAYATATAPRGPSRVFDLHTAHGNAGSPTH